jgi:hypothetical protein
MTHSYPFQSRSPIIARVVEGNSDWCAHANKPKERKAMSDLSRRNRNAWKSGDDVPQAKPDPIHGAIADFRSALDAYEKLVFAADNHPTLSNTFTLVSAELAKKRDALIDTVPRSAEGLAAVVAFVIGNEHLLLNFREALDASEMVRFLTTVARAAFAQAGLPARLPAPAAV